VSNTVILTAFVSRRARLVFLDVIFCPFEFSSVKSFRNQIAIEYLRKFVPLPSETLMSLNSKQKSLCQLTTAELFTDETGKQQKSGKSAFGSNALD